MPVEDAKTLWGMYSTGLIGPYKDYIISMNQIVMQKQSNDLFIQANSKKRHRPDDNLRLDTVYPSVFDWMMMGKEVEQEDFAKKSARDMILISDGCPQWLIDAVKE